VKVIQIPSFAADYNDHMGGVDIGDQYKASLGLHHRFCKGNWRAMAWSFLLDTALVNSYLLQRHGKPNWKPIQRQQDWRRRVAEELFKAYGKDGMSRQRLKAGDIFTPISNHNHVRRGKGSACVPCRGIKAGQTRHKQQKRQPLGEVSGNSIKARKTDLGCDVCDVAICTSPNCWYFYHSDVCR
jgi:hypothetical protein